MNEENTNRQAGINRRGGVLIGLTIAALVALIARLIFIGRTIAEF